MGLVFNAAAPLKNTLTSPAPSLKPGSFRFNLYLFFISKIAE